MLYVDSFSNKGKEGKCTECFRRKSSHMNKALPSQYHCNSILTFIVPYLITAQNSDHYNVAGSNQRVLNA